MITQACNLSCVGCTNYSDLTHAGYVPWSHGRKWLEAWLERMDILDFGIMGGEPLINPQWHEWLRGVREMLPTSQIRFTTNGLLLHRYPDLLDSLIDIGNVSFKITVHVQDSSLEDTIEHILQSRQWQPVVEHGIARYLTENQVRLHIKRPDRFIKTYKNHYADMMPWHSEPNKAFACCVQQTCPLLYQGKIYKCSTSGLLKDTLTRFGNPNLDQWQQYLAPGLDTACSDHSLRDFIANFGSAHAQCGQCPSAEHLDAHLDHMFWVTRK